MKFVVDISVGMPAVGKQYGHLADELHDALCNADLQLDWVGSIDSVDTPSEREAEPASWEVTTDAVPLWLRPDDLVEANMTPLVVEMQPGTPPLRSEAFTMRERCEAIVRHYASVGMRTLFWNDKEIDATDPGAIYNMDPGGELWPVFELYARAEAAGFKAEHTPDPARLEQLRQEEGHGL